MKRFLLILSVFCTLSFVGKPDSASSPIPAAGLGVKGFAPAPQPASAKAVPRDRDAVPEGLAKSDWSSIRAAYEAGRHAFQPTATGWQARNPGQQWTTKFDGRGFVAEPKDGGWQWGLELKSYGFGEQQRAIRGTPAVTAEGRRLTYDWDAAVQEWWVNDARGLEHGFTVKERPALFSELPESPLSFTLATRGTLHPRVSADAQGVLFADASGATVLNYSGLKVWDADGKVLASHFMPAGSGVLLLVEERGARYPLTIDPIAQQAYLKPAAVGTTQAGDQFGYSVAVSGDTVVVGAPGEDGSATGVNGTPNELAAGSAGAAYVFIRSAGLWSQQAYLKPAAVGPGGQAGDHFGWSVAISGDTVVVGAPDEDSATTGVNSAPAEGATNSGAAYVYTRNGGVWSQQAYLKSAVVIASDEFGYSVAVNGDTLVVGAYDEGSSTTGINTTSNVSAPGAGAAFVFVRSGSSWSQQAYLKPAAVGTTQANDHFGNSVALSGDTVVVGAFQEDSSSIGINSTPNELAAASGAAYVFARTSGVWTQQAYLKPAAVGTSQANDHFGNSVTASGNTVVVGANQESSSTTGVNSTPNETGASAGAAYVFTLSAGVWSQQAYLKPAAVGATQVGDSFGWSVALSGDTLAVGATGEGSSTTVIDGTPNELASGAGAGYVFTRSAGVWTQQAYLKPVAVGTTQAGDNFGFSVAVSGDTVVVGAWKEDSSTTGVNSPPNEGSIDSGAAYTFTGFGTLLDADGDGLLDSWELTYWPTIVGHSALDDFDHDGYSELLELALGLNPTLSDAGGLPPVTNEGGFLTMTITKHVGVTYEVQSAGTLLPALPDSFSPASTTVLTNNATTLKVRDNFLIGTPPARFIRLKVTAAP